MTAPSLILLGHGSHDPQVAQVSHQIREGLLAIRPELDIHAAFLDHDVVALLTVRDLQGNFLGGQLHEVPEELDVLIPARRSSMAMA